MLLGRHELSDRRLDGGGHGGVEGVVVDELEGHQLDGLRLMVSDREDDRGREVHGGLVIGDRRELQLAGLILHWHLPVHLLREGDDEVQPRVQGPAVLAEQGHHADMGLIDRLDRCPCNRHHNGGENQDDDDASGTHLLTPCIIGRKPAEPPWFEQARTSGWRNTAQSPTLRQESEVAEIPHLMRPRHLDVS